MKRRMQILVNGLFKENPVLILVLGCCSVLAVSVFIAARQPYAGILCFALLVTKTFVIMKMEAKQ